MARSAASLASHHRTMIRQCDELADTNKQTESLQVLQKSLDANVLRLAATNQATEHAITAASNDGLADAMIVLARAVDVLTTRLPKDPAVRRAA